jgi:hypothetical protein
MVSAACNPIELYDQVRRGPPLAERSLNRLVDMSLLRIEVVLLETTSVRLFGCLVGARIYPDQPTIIFEQLVGSARRGTLANTWCSGSRQHGSDDRLDARVAQSAKAVRRATSTVYEHASGGSRFEHGCLVTLACRGPIWLSRTQWGGARDHDDGTGSAVLGKDGRERDGRSWSTRLFQVIDSVRVSANKFARLPETAKAR